MNTNFSIYLKNFRQSLVTAEKSEATIEKYMRDVNLFAGWLFENKSQPENETGNDLLSQITSNNLKSFKEYLLKRYSPKSANSVLSSLNKLLDFLGLSGLKLKTVKIQRSLFFEKDKELTKQEYERLLKASRDKNNQRLYYLMQTICSTGIRVSELKFITVEAIEKKTAVINLKGKIRTVLLSKQLCKILKEYAKSNNIKSGSIFVTKTGRPLDRSNLWHDMKKLCESANVKKEKVFPHNLRHLFARTYYNIQKDIVRLADILGHSNIETTRIYTMESGDIHRRQIEKVHMLLC